MNTPLYDLNAIQQCVNNVGNWTSSAVDYAAFTADAINNGYIHQTITNAAGTTFEYWIKTGLSTVQDNSQQYAPVVSVLTGGAGAYSLSAIGVLATTTVGAVAAGICSALAVGLGVGLYNLAPEFWENVSRALVPWAYPDATTYIGLRPQSSYSAYLIDTIVDTNGVTYVPEDAVQAVGNYLVENNIHKTVTQDITFDGTFRNYQVSTSLGDGSIPAAHYFRLNDIISHFGLNITNADLACGDISLYASGDISSSVRIYRNAFNNKCAGQNHQSTTFSYYTLNFQTQQGSPVLSLPYTTYIRFDEGEEVSYHTIEGQEQIPYVYKGYIQQQGLPTKYYCDNLNITHTGAEIPGINYQEDGVAFIGGTIAQTYPEWDADKIIGPAEFGENVSYVPLELPVLPPEIYGYDVPQEIAQDPSPTDETIPEIENKNDQLRNPQNYPTSETNPQPDPDPDPDAKDKDSGPSNLPMPVAYFTEADGTGLVKIYNPSKATLSSFSQWLWSTGFIDNIKKLMQNPMEAVIGLHIVYCSPVSLGTANIRAGFVDSGIACNYVSQYTSLSCGSVSIPEHFGNALDYSPYTNAYIYLPFIGIKGLRADDIVGGTVAVDYGIDVLTGDCLANITVTRNGVTQMLYSFDGNCAIQLPITGGSFSSLTSSIITGAASVIGTALSGGNVVSSVIGAAANAVANAKADITKSGSCTGNAGAFGPRNPFIIISREVTSQLASQGQFYGYPANKRVNIGNCIGYTRVKDVHVEGIVATTSEIELIEQILKEGFIV